jgi:hypothetical protein
LATDLRDFGSVFLRVTEVVAVEGLVKGTFFFLRVTVTPFAAALMSTNSVRGGYLLRRDARELETVFVEDVSAL